jgi:hypothetical protein
MTTIASQKTVETTGQYSPAKILGLWAATALPLGFMGWVVFPALAPDWGVDPMGVGYARMGTIAVALFWELALALIIVRREEGDLAWSTPRGIQRRANPVASCGGGWFPLSSFISSALFSSAAP